MTHHTKRKRKMEYIQNKEKRRKSNNQKQKPTLNIKK
jgi:hypothetical protein